LNYLNINGRITTANEAQVPVDNGSFRYGYGLFETMLVHNGHIKLQEYHFERLFAGLHTLRLHASPLMTPTWLNEQVMNTARKNGLEKLCRVRLQMFAGSGGLYDRKDTSPQFVIECFTIASDTLKLNENGLVTGFATGISKSNDQLANLKSCNALIYAMAAHQARGNKWNDALISNVKGNIIESTIANIFWIKDGTIFTPPLCEGCIAGVMRRHLMAVVPVQEKVLTKEILLQADEVFLTNAIRTIRWIVDLEGSRFSSEKTRELHTLLSKG